MNAAPADVALLILRVVIGATFIAHGWNHAFGGGGLAGTTRWFGQLGMRHPRLQAVNSTVTEIGAGLLLVLGLLLPLAAAALIAICCVAGITAHRRNGFFIFRDGYEYVLVLGAACAALALAGPGRISVDEAVGLSNRVPAPVAFGVAVGLGILGAVLVLAAFWRPAPSEAAREGVAAD
ncbi:DoxX family protein [Streptosporangium amethystogenes]|uniref:DoxX family protein n=1 Tax=Streptosporangium amethystogenes TaxID=2002 RepID=UPI0037BE0C80